MIQRSHLHLLPAVLAVPLEGVIGVRLLRERRQRVVENEHPLFAFSHCGLGPDAQAQVLVSPLPNSYVFSNCYSNFWLIFGKLWEARSRLAGWLAGKPDYPQKLKVPEGYEKINENRNIWHGIAEVLIAKESSAVSKPNFASKYALELGSIWKEIERKGT